MGSAWLSRRRQKPYPTHPTHPTGLQLVGRAGAPSLCLHLGGREGPGNSQNTEAWFPAVSHWMHLPCPFMSLQSCPSHSTCTPVVAKPIRKFHTPKEKRQRRQTQAELRSDPHGSQMALFLPRNAFPLDSSSSKAVRRPVAAGKCQPGTCPDFSRTENQVHPCFPGSSQSQEPFIFLCLISPPATRTV